MKLPHPLLAGYFFISLLASCYSSPFREETERTRAQPRYRYYAFHVRFSRQLLAIFAQHGCNYNSADSWTVYLSRDPHSYPPLRERQLPDFRILQKISDVKLFLPTGSHLLDVYQRNGLYSSFPVITAEKPRSYSLTVKEEEALSSLMRQMEQGEPDASARKNP
ncbi:MAG: hypothetical protein AAF975_01115 [Spirochaetota bacterium]